MIQRPTTHPFAKPNNHGTITQPTRDAIIAVARRHGLDDPGDRGEFWTQLGPGSALRDHLSRLISGDNVVARRFSELFDGPEDALTTLTLALQNGIRVHVGDVESELTSIIGTLRPVLGAVVGTNKDLRLQMTETEAASLRTENARIEQMVTARVAGVVFDAMNQLDLIRTARREALAAGLEARG